ncbi:MAG: ATP-binding protein, partial [Wenzhouxiangellaceae bacterium]
MADAATLPMLLRQLRLPTMVACCDEVTDRAAQHGWSLQQALATLCEYELSEREQRRLQRHLHEALVQELQAAKQALSLSDALTKLDKYRLLII